MGIMLAAGSEIVAVKLVVRNMTVPGTVMFSGRSWAAIVTFWPVVIEVFEPFLFAEGHE